MSTLSSKLTSLKSKVTTLEVKDIKYPDNITNVLDQFKKNSSPKTASANDWTIDVFPNQITPMMYIMQVASQASSAADHKDQAKSSLATFCMYYCLVFQSFFLLNDLHVRPSASPHAASWSTIHWKAKLAEFLLSLPVPESMETLFAQLSATETERTNNVFFIPSAAGFNLKHFFGRFIPVNFFAALHDCIATMPGNSTPGAIQQDFLLRKLFTLPTNYTTGKTSVNCADLLGIHSAGTTPTYCTSKFYQVFSSVFNPVLFRDFHRRSSLATLDLQITKFKAAKSINAYDLLIAGSSYNASELITVVNHLLPIIRSVTPMKKTLCDIISSANGISILQHGYSTYAIPTWTFSPDSETATPAATPLKLRPEDYAARATQLRFLQDADKTTHTPRDVHAATVTGTNASVATYVSPWSLISNTHVPHPFPSNDEHHFVTFDEDVHPTPRVLVLDVSASGTVSAPLATLVGMIIESFEIDGTTIEHPNIDKSLASQNSLFADSAVPFKYVLFATRFYVRTADLPPVLKRHLPKPSTSQPAATLLHNRTNIMLPQINQKTATFSANGTILDPTSTTTVPGLKNTGITDWIRFCQSFFGFNTRNPTSTNEDDDSIASMEQGRLYLWSPYTYTPIYDADCDEVIPDLSASRSYFITNLRSFFGTDYNLVEVTHPFVAMPV